MGLLREYFTHIPPSPSGGVVCPDCQGLQVYIGKCWCGTWSRRAHLFWCIAPFAGAAAGAWFLGLVDYPKLGAIIGWLGVNATWGKTTGRI